jgi:LPXTG-motif cell wall-anchored protein
MVKLRYALMGSLVVVGALGAALAQAAGSFSASGTTCRDITWKPEVLAKYPHVSDACQGVVQKGGETYVKFVGTVQNNSPVGLRMKFKGTDESVLIKPTSSQQVAIGGQTFKAREMEPGQELTFYVPSTRFAASLGDEPEPEVIDIIELPAAPGMAEPAPAPASGAAASLPKTASNLPWLAVLGGLLALCGLAMTLLRRRRVRA